jgi:hypothetical protein
MKTMMVIATLALLCSPVVADIENTVWEYDVTSFCIVGVCLPIPDVPPSVYGFYDGDVYKIIDGHAFKFPSRPDCFGWYTDGFAFMHVSEMGITGSTFSFFNAEGALQIGSMYGVIPYAITYDLTCIGLFMPI